jgi:putative transposase
MRELGLRACQPRAYRRTTLPGDHPVASPDLIERDFTAAAPGVRLVGDITSRPARAGRIWPSSSTWPPAWWSAGRPPSTCAPRWSSTRCRWPSPTATSSPVRCSTPTRAPNIHRPSSTHSVPANGAYQPRPYRGLLGQRRRRIVLLRAETEMYHRETFTTRARARFAVADFIETSHQRFVSSVRRDLLLERLGWVVEGAPCSGSGAACRA